MKRHEKNMHMHQKIIDSACREFSDKRYGEASLNTICSAGNLSKGIIYHYFKDKDALYLACVKECFDALTAYLQTRVSIDAVPTEGTLAGYFDARIAFFAAHPSFLGIFYSAIIAPPLHLLSAIDELTADFNAQAVSILMALLNTLTLRPDITKEEVVTVFREYQDFAHARFKNKTLNERTLKEHEDRSLRSLHILLYGVIKREA